jgi:hypothetical protein
LDRKAGYFRFVVVRHVEETKVIIYRGKPGETVWASAANAIALAGKHNRKIKMRFNGKVIEITKRLSVNHVVNTWRHMVSAEDWRYRNSPAFYAEQTARRNEILALQSQLDSLVFEFPKSKADTAEWLAKWIPISDDCDVDRKPALIVELLKGLGFVSGEHVDSEVLRRGDASGMMMLEWVAGQSIDMLQSQGCVHPLLADYAKKAADAMQAENAVR